MIKELCITKEPKKAMSVLSFHIYFGYIPNTVLIHILLPNLFVVQGSRLPILKHDSLYVKHILLFPIFVAFIHGKNCQYENVCVLCNKLNKEV